MYGIATKSCNRLKLVLPLLFVLLSLLFVTCSSASVFITSDIRLDNTENANHPAWSPDGTKIVYTAGQDIWIMDSDGSGHRKLYGGLAWIGDPEFGQDGTNIYFARTSRTSQTARYISVHVMDTDGSNEKKLTFTADSRSPSISTDGKRLAYISRASGNYDIWTMDTDGNDRIRVTDSNFDDSSPSWHPEGNTLIYSSGGDIFSIGANGLGLLKLTDDTHNNIDPAISPDGRMIAYSSDLGGDYNIWLMDPEGKAFVKLTGDSSSERAPAWSPDGGRLAYVSDRDGVPGIWVMTMNTSDMRLEEYLDKHDEYDEDIKGTYVGKVRDYAMKNPYEFIGIVLFVSFGCVLLIVGSFLRKIS